MFSVATVKEARDLQVRLCRLSYDGRDYRLPNQRHDGALLELEDLDDVTLALRDAHTQLTGQRAAARRQEENA